MQIQNMDLPKKNSNKYVKGVYAVFIIFFIYTLSSFYISRCHNSSRLAKQDDEILKPKRSADNIPKISEKSDISKEPWENKTKASKSNNIADDENIQTPLAKKETSEDKKVTVDGQKTPTIEASDPTADPIQPQPALTSVNQKVVIYFSAESTGLTNQALEKLKAITEFILKYPDMEIIIEGYGDSNENSRHNKSLSRLRANIVKSYLVKKGIAVARVKAFWMGSDNPTGGNDSQEDSNRAHQVEVKFKINS